MAVEAQHLNLFPSQLIGNRREMISAIEGNVSNTYQNSTPIRCGLPPPVSGTTTDTMIPMMYGGCSAITDSVPPAMKADSGLTYALPVSVRKRSRVDSIDNPLLFPNNHIRNHINNNNNNNNNRCAGGGSFTFLGQDVSLQIQQQQLEIDRFIAQHTEKVRLEIEERRKRYSSGIITAVEEGIMKRLRAKEEEIEKIGKLNWALEERVKSLYVENQIWRDLAQTNEATANALRTNLEQLLVQQQQVKNNDNNCSNALDCDDAQSCCGSNYDNDEEEERRSLTVDCGGERKVVVKKDKKTSVEDDDCTVAGGSSRMMMMKKRRRRRLCRHCGKEESCVLLLPCRHLCLCTVCGSSVHCCPICNTPKNASLRVIISSP